MGSHATFRIACWNILAPEYSAEGFGDVDFYEDVRPWVPWPVRASRVIEQIAALDADIACLQEVSPEPWDELSTALASRGLVGERLNKRLPRQRDGVATLVRSSRIEVLKTEALSFHDGTGFVTLFQHLRVGVQELVVANTHLKWSPDDTMQPSQMNELLAVLDAMPPAPRIICGDLNIDPRAHAMWETLASRGFRPAYEERSLTWSARRNALRLDEILYGPGLELVEVEPLREIHAGVPLPDAQTPSDHLPLAATLRFVG